MTPGAKIPRAIVFDLDGTLIDSLPLVLKAIEHGLEPYGSRPTMEIFAKLGGPPERFMANLLEDARHVSEAVRRMEVFHRAHYHAIEPFGGAVDFLVQLHREGVKLAIWTGRERASTEVLLGRLRLTDYFATVLCGDDLPTHKPDPAGLREILRRLGVAADETLYVGDADVDVLGGVACGVDTMLIRHGREIAAEVSVKACDVVASPSEAFAAVLRRLSRSG